jgi:Fur family ferric uptake transcriptional regulator
MSPSFRVIGPDVACVEGNNAAARRLHLQTTGYSVPLATTVTAPRTGPPLDAPDLEAAVEALRAQGLRVSSARRLVLEALFRASGPISVEQIADGLAGKLPRSDLASVYRNLETLEEIGLVRHFHLGHGPGLYALAGLEREHLVCDSCSAVLAVDPADMDEVRSLIRARFGYEARFSHFPIVGLCDECAREEPRDPPERRHRHA